MLTTGREGFPLKRYWENAPCRNISAYGSTSRSEYLSRIGDLVAYAGVARPGSKPLICRSASFLQKHRACPFTPSLPIMIRTSLDSNSRQTLQCSGDNVSGTMALHYIHRDSKANNRTTTIELSRPLQRTDAAELSCISVCFGLGRLGPFVPDGTANDGTVRVVADALAALAVGATWLVAKKRVGE